MYLIVGLGNPEDKYNGTRHNLGFAALDEYVRKHSESAIVTWEKKDKFKSEILKLNGHILIKPQTYMNNSGMAVSAVVNFYKVLPENIVVIYDELDLPLGKIKLRLGGAAAGHHGVESIIEKIGTDKFLRLRLGIGNLRTQSGERKGEHFSAENYVLESFMPNEKSDVKRMLKSVVKALDTLLEKGLEKNTKSI